MNLRLEDGRSEERSGGKASNSTNHIIIINDEMPSFSATDVEESKSEMLPVKTEKGQPGSEDHLKQKKSSVLNFSAGRTQVLALRDKKLENETLCPKEHHTSANTQRCSLTVPEIFPPRSEKDHPNSEGYLDTMENTGVTFIDENGLEIIPPGVKINDLKILQIKIEEDDPEDSWSSGSEDSDSPETVTTPKEPFVCTYCGKEFNKKFNFQIHQLVHTGEKPFTCSECGKSFSQKRILQTHLKVHTGEKPFTCTECGKCFAQKIHLHTHQKVHTGEKPHTCPDCGKCFSVKSNLRKHQIVHTGEKPFKCTECGKGFTRKIHLTKHHKLHIGV
uniref:C2H2-type domain-containing protein n=1 Tax=Xenopus tropicalis TaxID=8364 RepID=A0A6I8RE45_XENTR